MLFFGVCFFLYFIKLSLVKASVAFLRRKYTNIQFSKNTRFPAKTSMKIALKKTTANLQ